MGTADAWSVWTWTLAQVPYRVSPPRSTTREPRPWGRVTSSRDPTTERSQTLGSPKANQAAWPGRSTTGDPAGPSGTDGAVTGRPWGPSSRTPGMPLTVQVLAEALRSRMVVQIVPAAPSMPWTEPASAEASQRPVTGRSPDGPTVEGGVPVAVGRCDGAVASGAWGAADGWVAVEWALQPVTATAAANATVAMILAARMVVPPELARRWKPRT